MKSALSVGLVDAGFLKAACANTLQVKPSDVRIDYSELLVWFRQVASRINAPFLRSYWYDGAYDSSHPAHPAQRSEFNRVADTPGFQLRLGHLEKRKAPWQGSLRRAVKECGWDIEELKSRFEMRDTYEQKGVDTLIVLDLVRMAQSETCSHVILMSGDRDLAEAVRTAQDAGTFVIVAHPKSTGISKEIARLSDETIKLSDDLVRRIATHE
ncbi:NYN domain-containing protein [Streptomyces iakyrus]|uniref:NYN domain-containing protein n=1 Tax=Streptomyces iakyrus TaxID=68219 RepID=UPI0033BB6CFE